MAKHEQTGKAGVGAAILTRVAIQVGQLSINDGKLQGWITIVAEQDIGPGRTISGNYFLDRAKTNAQRRTDLRDIAMNELPAWFDGGITTAANFIVEYYGI